MEQSNLQRVDEEMETQDSVNDAGAGETTEAPGSGRTAFRQLIAGEYR